MNPIPELYAPNLICVCFDERTDDSYSGRLYTQYDKEPFRFNSVIDMALRMDRLYDDWDFPQSATLPRTFHRAKPIVQKTNILESGLTPDHARIYSQKGKTATFIVRVKYRQNATWQGEVVWLEEAVRQEFRSALELMKLLQDALGA